MTGFVRVRWCVHILHQYNPLTRDSHRGSFSPAMESFILHTQRSLARSLAQRSPLHAATTLKLRSSCFGNMILRHTVCSTRSSPLHFLLWAFHHSTIFSSKMAAFWWPALWDCQVRHVTRRHNMAARGNLPRLLCNSKLWLDTTQNVSIYHWCSSYLWPAFLF